ncbi:TetR/AcrR family transcriptional regulator [Aeromicrobium sp. CF4.19]|uniref:TetR/AcrR family transcriptional regulator n=1 Tax=Aeromicrobium sp. CF4.19 TaxID=3373082 RepID=UPI003EE5FF8F
MSNTGHGHRSLSRSQTDGRVERRLRTQRAIVAAHTALLRGGDVRPRAAQIAEEAGVSVRTLWAAFGDMEGLLQATTDYWFEVDDELRSSIDPELSLPQRIELFCAERARRLENISPAARAAVLMEVDSPTLRESRRGHVQRVLDDVARTFDAELEAVPDRAVVFDAVVAATSWNAWSLLRDDLDRPVDAALAAMIRAVTAILGPPPG